MTVYNYQIAAAWDNAAGLTNVESITPSVSGAALQLGSYWNAAYIAIQSTQGTYNVPLTLANAPNLVQNGNATQLWRFAPMAVFTYEYLIATYIRTPNGKITIKTRTDSTTYANQNASVLTYTLPEDGTIYRRGRYLWIAGCVWRIALLGTPS